jgi:D-3-phosphoglycerate dehydrogenase
MPRIFVTGPTLAEEAKALLSRWECVCAFGSESDSPNDIARKLAAFQPDGLIVRKGRITDAVMGAAGTLKAISKHGVGVDNIDVTAATRRGIPVMITPRANCESVAEHALALILALSRRILSQDRKVRQGIWDRGDQDIDDLRGKTLGLVGFGRIAQRLVELVRPFEMRVLIFDPYARSMNVCARFVDLRELLSQADIVSIHCPLTPETRGLIGCEQLALMKRAAWIVNTARGAVIDEAALIEALREERIAGAALDTFSSEPPCPANPLFAMDNVVLSAHIGGLSRSSFRNMGVGAVENVLSVLDGRMPDPACLVNPEVFGKVISEELAVP